MAILEEFKEKITQKEFLDDEIMNMAEKLGKEFKGITTTKMRQYFEDIKGLRRIIESKATPAQIKTKLQLILSRIHYDTKRAKTTQRQVMTNLKDFIASAISKVLKSNNVLQEATNFSIFFENFYGYFYFYAEKTEKEEE